LFKLRELIDELTTAFTTAIGPLSVAFSIKLAPIVNEREIFFRSQMGTVAKRGMKIKEIMSDMQELIERRQQLEDGQNNLTRMFGVLVKFRSSLGIEEEEDAEFDLEAELEGL
jgi:hypothetical protein